MSERVWQETGNVRLYLDALKGELAKPKSSVHQARIRMGVPTSGNSQDIKKARHERASKKERVLERERRSTPKPVAVELRFQRASAFLAFITIVESKGLPARIIDEDKLASIAAARQWDQIPLVLAHLIRNDEEVKVAFQAFESASCACAQQPSFPNVKGWNSIETKQQIAELYRKSFMHAASIYSRRFQLLQASLDKLSSLSLDDLQALADAGDDLSTRIASISLKISDEIKRREARKGAKAKDEKLEPVRQFALKLANDGNYPSRRQAVFAIKAGVLDYARTLDGVSLSEQQAEKTIDGWLKDLGYAPSASKQGTSAG